MATVTRTARVGSNRGKPRLWLEGQWLADLGFSRGTKFTVTWEPDITLRVVPGRFETPHTRIVSGKGDRPIIDIAGEKLQRWAAFELTLTGRPGVITIRRAHV